MHSFANEEPLGQKRLQGETSALTEPSVSTAIWDRVVASIEHGGAFAKAQIPARRTYRRGAPDIGLCGARNSTGSNAPALMTKSSTNRGGAHLPSGIGSCKICVQDSKSTISHGLRNWFRTSTPYCKEPEQLRLARSPRSNTTRSLGKKPRPKSGVSTCQA